MNTFSDKYIFPIKFLPWVFWIFISIAGIYLFTNAWTN